MTSQPEQEMDQRCINTLRTLAIDQVEKAKSGHPGTPLGAAPVAYILWQYVLRFDPNASTWLNRDRFVLSAGHASALLYGLLFLCGVQAERGQTSRSGAQPVTMADLQSFRQTGSRCTGHPEHGWTSGVECTTGPLGQGAANSVGMAIAQTWLAATFNRPDFTLFDYRVFALVSDGDMMEGLSSEAASMAGHLKLGRLCWIYDCNHISIEGSTEITFTENVGARFAAYGWKVVRVADANDLQAIAQALRLFEAGSDQPMLIIVTSVIGYGAPHKQGTAAAHGEPLGVAECRATKQFFGFDPDLDFAVPDGVREHFGAHFALRGATRYNAWCMAYATYRLRHPELALQMQAIQQGQLAPQWDALLPTFRTDSVGLATRESSAQVLNAIAPNMPWLLGGAADLAPSTKTALLFGGSGEYSSATPSGRNIHFGIREHAMCAVASGMALCGLRAFAAGFFVFTDYCRGAMRLASMMRLPVIYIWTHDSIALGEDGPTHQPVEQLASLRAMPGMVLLRPADANEVVQAWRVVMQLRDRPASLVLSRQALPTLDRSRYASADGVARGAYILADAVDGQPEVLLLASGSEVVLCIRAYEQLQAQGVKARVVSMPSWDLFEQQDAAYQAMVLPSAVRARVSVEAAAALGWDRYTGRDGEILAMHTFGASEPGQYAGSHFGFDVTHVMAAAYRQLHLHAGERCA